jgi:nucleotide sugar dehydrogenase
MPSPTDPNWNITSSFSESIENCEVIIVTVPTPVSADKHLDETNVSEAGESIFQNITPSSGKVVVLESTVYPGFTNKIWSPLAKNNGLNIGSDIHLAYCPERYNPGDAESTISNTNRIVGSMDSEVGELLVELYSTISEASVFFVGQMEVAESSKLIENVQRDINIALVNELSMILPNLGIDIEEVLEAASTKWNFHRYFPGIGVGGHCIPVDPYFLIDQATEKNSSVHLISTARMINSQMPAHVAELVMGIIESHQLLPGQTSLLLLGWSYKPNIGDTRGSPSLELATILNEKGIDISVFDPFVPSNQFPDFISVVSEENGIEGFDMIVLATAHDKFEEIDWKNVSMRMKNKIIFDGRRCLDLDNLRKNGWDTYALGKPNQ